MKPGKRLDAMIAFHVFGFLQGTHLALTKNYSTDISAAWEVVEKMGEGGFRLACDIDGWAATWEQYQNAYHRGSETAPHAICLAALKAVGVEV